jgi:hypothetical protein
MSTLSLSGLEVVNADLKGRAVKLIAAKDKQTEKPKVRCLGLFDTVGQIYVGELCFSHSTGSC